MTDCNCGKLTAWNQRKYAMTTCGYKFTCPNCGTDEQETRYHTDPDHYPNINFYCDKCHILLGNEIETQDSTHINSYEGDRSINRYFNAH